MSVPEDSILRRHYHQLHGTSNAATSSTGSGSNSGGSTSPQARSAYGATAAPQKGFFGRLLDKLTGRS